MSALLNSTKSAASAGALACLAALMQPAEAQERTDMTTSVVLDRMSSVELTAYLAGVVEGLAYARYQRDGQTTEGMACIYDWFYETPETMRDIFNTFDRFPDHLPGAVMAAMVEKACGS